MSHPPGADHLQQLVDDLAHELGRSVALDNPALELVAASAHTGPIDERRVASIITRTPPPEPLPWLLGLGIQQAVAPVRVPANDEFGMLPRVCFPVRHHRRLVGFLWLFDEPVVSPDEEHRTQLAADSMAVLLAGAQDGLLQRAEALDAACARVLQGDEAALRGVRDEGLLPSDGEPRVHLVLLAPDQLPAAESEAAPRRLQLELARAHPLRPVLARPAHGGVVLVESSRTSAEAQQVQQLLRRAMVVSRSAASGAGSASVASCGPRRAVERALFAARVAELLGRGAEPLAWEELGSWRLLFGWELSAATVGELSPDAARLVAAGSRGHWRTVLAHLDHAGATGATAQDLFVHRATLHHRLQRAGQMLAEGAAGQGVLDDGWRLASLHVALRLQAALDDARAAGR